MPAIIFRKRLWRGGGAIVAAMTAACLYCAINSVETTPFGLLVGPVVALSVILFLALERTCSARWPKYVGFFLPMFAILGGCFYQIWSLRSHLPLEGVSDGGDGIVVYFTQCYAVGLFFAFPFLLWRKRVTTDPRANEEVKKKERRQETIP